MDDKMTVRDLIALLQEFPPDARIIVEEIIDTEPLIESYANASAPEIRYLHHHDRGITWDFTPTVETADGAELVILIAPHTSERER